MGSSPTPTFLPPPTNPTADRHLQNPCLGIPHTITHPSTQIFPPHISIVLYCPWTNHHLTVDGRMLLWNPSLIHPKTLFNCPLFLSTWGSKNNPPRRSAHVHKSPTLHPLQGATPWYGCTTLRIHAGPPTYTEISPDRLPGTNHHVTVTLSLPTSFSPLHQFFF